VESLELHLDAASQQRVRELWEALLGSGIASLARHDYNTPHVTLAALAHTEGRLTQSLPLLERAATGLVGHGVTLSGLATFPHTRSVLYASVVPTIALLHGHVELHELLAARGLAPYGTSLPARWTPHCTLAKRVRTDELGAAFAALADCTWPIEARVARVIHWDGATREVTTLAA